MTQPSADDSAIRYERTASVFQEVRRLPAHARAQRLIELCGGDVAMQGEVLELLEYDGESDWLDEPLGRIRPAVEAPPRIPGYQVEEKLGEGGFAVVYKARQIEPIERVVAVKVLKHSVSGRAPRFQRLHQHGRRDLDAGRPHAHAGRCSQHDRRLQHLFHLQHACGVAIERRRLPSLR
jgi:hypothetical protein